MGSLRGYLRVVPEGVCPWSEVLRTPRWRGLDEWYHWLAVMWKHLSFGTQRDHGSRFVERPLTVIETCRQQSRNLFAFLIDTLTVHLAAQPDPTL